MTRAIRSVLLACALYLALPACVCEGVTVTVTSTNDNGPGTLRQAILETNTSTPPNLIEFNLPGLVPFVIALTNTLPTVTNSVIIDGWSQPGYALSGPVVKLTGSSGGARLKIEAPTSTVRGLILANHVNQGLRLAKKRGIVVEGCHIVSNYIYGIELFLTDNARIGGSNTASRNVISGNGGSGIYLMSTASNTVIQGNYIGVMEDGLTASPNNWRDVFFGGGVWIEGKYNTVGPSNVISGNTRDGVFIRPADARHNVVIGNLIGLDASGTVAVPNTNAGVCLSLCISNRVGGTLPGERNVISGNSGSGVEIIGSPAYDQHNSVLGNLIGLRPDGLTPLGNGQDGVTLLIGMANTIGDTSAASWNVISGNMQAGIRLDLGSERNVIIQNFIGPDATGLSPASNASYGVYLADGVSNTIGGLLNSERNVISGNGSGGVLMEGSTTRYNVVQANYIGTSETGIAPLSNNGSGIHVRQDANNNTIGGTASGAGNVISGNREHGILIEDAHHISVEGNLIGTHKNGFSALSNGWMGVVIAGGSNNTIGGADAASRNVISGNGEQGIFLSTTDAVYNIVQGNYVGTDIAGAGALPNGADGIRLSSARNNLIGGSDAGEGNRVAFNEGSGIAITTNISGVALGNTLRGNVVYSNDLLALDLEADGITTNDPAPDADSGPNDLQNYPVLTNAFASSTHVQGQLVSGISQPYTLEFFATPEAIRQSQQLLGSVVVTTDVTGVSAFTANLLVSTPSGWWVVATATDTNGNTSEFAAPIQVTALLDTDGDGIPDVWETRYGLNPAVSNTPTDDADSDLVPDLYEYFGDTHPTNDDSYLRITSISHGSDAAVVVASSSNRYYALDYITNLVSANWVNVSYDTQGNATNLVLTDADATDGTRIYRVKARVP